MAQTSINIQPVKGGSEQHNKREKQLDYVRPDLFHLNEYWESDTQTARLEYCKKNAKEKTGRKMQEKATPIREAVVVINPSTTMNDLKRLAEAYRQKFRIEAFQIAIHKDEGFSNAKEWKPNLHAHIVFDWTNHETGKSIKLNRADMVEMQSITADVLGMERGISSEKKHLNAVQYKIQASRTELEEIQEAIEENKPKAEIRTIFDLVTGKTKDERRLLNEKIKAEHEKSKALEVKLSDLRVSNAKNEDLLKERIKKFSEANEQQNKTILEMFRALGDSLGDKFKRFVKQCIEEKLALLPIIRLWNGEAIAIKDRWKRDNVYTARKDTGDLLINGKDKGAREEERIRRNQQRQKDEPTRSRGFRR